MTLIVCSLSTVILTASLVPSPLLSIERVKEGKPMMNVIIGRVHDRPSSSRGFNENVILARESVMICVFIVNTLSHTATTNEKSALKN